MKKLLLMFGAVALSSGLALAQCANSGVQFGSGTAPGPGGTLTVTTCAYAGEYQVLSGVVAGNQFTVSMSGGASNFVTIYDATFTPIFWGSSPVSFTAPSAGTYYSQVNLTGCGTDFSCHTVVWTNTTPPPPCPSVITPWTDNVETHTATTTLGISNCWAASALTSFDWDITGTGNTPSFGTGAETANSGVKFFYTEAGHSRAIDDGPFHVFERRVLCGSQVAHEAACKGITSTRGVKYFGQGQRRGKKDVVVFKKQSSVLSFFDDQIARAHLVDDSSCFDE